MPDRSRTLRAHTETPAPPTTDRDEVVELHWMKEPDVEMHDVHGLSAPALCGAWMEPDEPLADRLTASQDGSQRFVSCAVCDALHELGQP